jgi:hypothetical protein
MYSRKNMAHGGPHPEDKKKRKNMAHGGPHPEDKKKRQMMNKGKMVNDRIMYAGGGEVLTPN